jgi:hypothetical protein
MAAINFDKNRAAEAERFGRRQPLRTSSPLP